MDSGMIYPGVYVERPKRFIVTVSEEECKMFVQFRMEMLVGEFMGREQTPDLGHNLSHAAYAALLSCMDDGLIPGHLAGPCHASTSVLGKTYRAGQMHDDGVVWPDKPSTSFYAVDIGIPIWLDNWLTGADND